MDIHVGRRLRLQRMLLGLSQKIVGEQVGVTFQQIQKYERGVNRVSAGLLHDFARVLNVPISFFFEDWSQSGAESAMEAGFAEPTAPGYDAGGLNVASKDAMEILKAYGRISDPVLRKKVLDLVRAMADSQVIK
jgi:transcriptional regulator with XRE-family HTH domain